MERLGKREFGTNAAFMAVLVTVAAAILVARGFEPDVTRLSPAFAESKPAVSAHAPVVLLDESGRRIELNSDKPYSPKQTCGACHDYEAINKAYHFQLGADQISDDYGKKVGKPWISSLGQFGRQQHMSYAWVAKKRNSTSAEVGMTPYQYSQACGACHAGGGPMERDRDGERYDTRQATHPELAQSLDGDYHKAAWDKSGVAEADCLMCHMPGYNAQARTDQLSKANFRWAAAVGAGLGTVDGSVKDGQTPILSYNRALFRPDGTVALGITSPEDANCLLCHGEAEVKKRGHVWHDARQADVHTAAGMKCVTCHTSGPDHQIRKGRSHEVVLHDHLDDPTLSCEGCHLSAESAVKPAHKSLPKSHLARIACVTCHVTEQNVAAVGVVDTATGKGMGLPTVKGAKKYGETGTWTPAYFRLKDGKIYSGNALLPAWWGNRGGGAIHPLHLSETGRAFERVKELIKDDNQDGKPEVNSETEIRAMLDAIRVVLAEGRFKQIAPAYVKGDKVWELVRGRLVSRPYPQAKPLYWTFSHNVSPAEKAWGANGCTDCHGSDSRFFNAPVIVDPFREDGTQKTVPMWQYCRIKNDAVRAGM
jgi:hypothetical protein